MTAGYVVLVEAMGVRVFAKEECQGGEERGSRAEPWRTLIFKRWLKGQQIRPRTRRE